MVPSTQGPANSSSAKNIKRLDFLAAFAELDSTMNMPPRPDNALCSVAVDLKKGHSSRANVRRLREAKGLSQAALAADAGIHQELMNRIEKRRGEPGIGHAGQIAAARGVHPRELLDE